MMKVKFVFILFLFLVVSSLSSYSQEETEMQMEEEMEEISQEKIIDPEIKLWYLSGDGAFKDSTKLDTLQDYFHLYHPVYKNAISVNYVGNYASPYLNNDFFNRDSKMDFFFLKSREAYLLTPAGIKYYNTRTPYTQMDYSQSESKNSKNETRFNVLHSQNVSPYLNFTFRYDQARSEGQYLRQESKNNFVSLYSSYNKDQLNIHAGFISNSIHNNENGGIASDSLIFSDRKSETLDVNLSDSKSQFGSSYFFATGEYKFGKIIEVESTDAEEEEEPQKKFRPILGVLYSFEYQRHLKQFYDNEDTLNTFFPVSYFGDDYLNDSIIFRKVKNIVQLKQYENADRKTSFGKRAFLGQEYVKSSMPGVLEDEVYRQTKKFSNIYAGGGIFRETGDFWTWNAEGKIFLLGRNIGQTELSGVISKPLTVLGDSLASFTVNASLENLVADNFQEEYYSNHIRWKNDFKMEQRMTVKGSFQLPKRKLKIGANYAILNNYIYNDTLGIPAQTEKELLILSAYLDKDFNYRNLHFRTRLLWQKASNDEFVHLPDFSAFVSTYYKLIISKVMFAQFGADARYNTSFLADEYDPSTGLFYLQNDKMIGEFPYIDVYASLRLKRTRLFFKMKNIGTEFINREYYTSPHYPMNRMTFRLGVSWVFYD